MAIAVFRCTQPLLFIDTLSLVTTFLTTTSLFLVYPTPPRTTFTSFETTIICSVQHSSASMHYLELSKRVMFDTIRHLHTGLLMSCRHQYTAVAFLLRVTVFLLYVLGNVSGMCTLLYGIGLVLVAVGACESWCYIPLNLAFVRIHCHLL